jgi:hypothetical protein
MDTRCSAVVVVVVVVRNLQRKGLLERHDRCSFKICCRGIKCDSVEWIQVIQVRDE